MEFRLAVSVKLPVISCAASEYPSFAPSIFPPMLVSVLVVPLLTMEPLTVAVDPPNDSFA